MGFTWRRERGGGKLLEIEPWALLGGGGMGKKR